MKWNYKSKVIGLTIELLDNGKIRIAGITPQYEDNKMDLDGLAVELWDALVDHLSQGKPLGYMKDMTPGHDRRVYEAKAAHNMSSLFVDIIQGKTK